MTNGTLMLEARKQWRAAFKCRTGLTCMFGAWLPRGCPPYVMDTNGYGVAFCSDNN